MGGSNTIVTITQIVIKGEISNDLMPVAPCVITMNMYPNTTVLKASSYE